MISLKGIFITNTTLLLSNRAEGKEWQFSIFLFMFSLLQRIN